MSFSFQRAQIILWVAAFAVSILTQLISHNLGWVPGYHTSTLVMVLSGLVVLGRNGFLAFPTILFVIIFVPALSPFYAWDFKNAAYFSLAAKYVQDDSQVIDAAVWLFAIGAVNYMLITFNPARQISTAKAPDLGVIGRLPALFLGAFVVLSAYVIDPGPTIWSANYTEILAGRFETSESTTLLVVLFGGAWVSLFLYARHHKAIFFFVTFVAAAWLFLHVRRVEVFGMALVLLIWMRSSFPKTRVLTILALFVFLQFIMGEIRTVGLKAYFTGADITPKSQVWVNEKAALPGGASNVFLAGLHIVDVKLNGFLRPDETLTILQWIKVIVPGFIWRAFDIQAATTEHQTIYQQLGLVYVGGMPLITVFFLNGGYFLVGLFGIIHGAFSKVIEYVVKNSFERNPSAGGSFALVILMTLILYQFRYHWYNPQTPIRALEVSIILWILMRVFVRFGKAIPASMKGFVEWPK